MKKTIVKLILLAFPLMLLSGCERDMGRIYDIFPIEININVYDKSGQNLLIPDTEYTLVGSEAYLMYDDQKYDIQWNTNEVEARDKLTRMYLARFYGLLHFNTNWQWENKEPNWALYIGEMDGAKTFDRTMYLTIGGEKHSLRVKNIYDSKSDGSPDIKREIYLDGKLQKNSTFKLTLKR